MIRFRNPSSSLETMLASFEQLYKELQDKNYFDNDDIAVVLAKANLMDHQALLVMPRFR